MLGLTAGMAPGTFDATYNSSADLLAHSLIPLSMQWQRWAAEFKGHGIPVRSCHCLWLSLIC